MSGQYPKSSAKPDGNHTTTPRWLLIVAAVFLSGLVGDKAYAQPGEVRIGVLAIRGIERTAQRWAPTAQYLSRKMPAYRFVIVPLRLDALRAAVERGELDFVLTNTGNYVELQELYGISRIATLVNLRDGKPYTKFGAVIFARADRKDIKSLDGLKGKSFAAVKKDAFGGFQMAWRELARQGIDPFDDFSRLEFVGLPQDKIVYAVRDGRADAGTVRTDVLERMAKEGKIRLEDYRVINRKITQDYAFVHSTALYPEWPFAKARRTSEKLAKQVTTILLGMDRGNAALKAAHIAGWTVPLNYEPVHQLMKELRIGPYEGFGKVTLIEVVKLYWQWVVAAFIVLACMVTVTVYVLRLNRKLQASKTELWHEITERKRFENEREEAYRDLEKTNGDLRETNKRLEEAHNQLVQSEKLASIGQLAAGVAHEINNPVGYVYSNLGSLQGYLQDLYKVLDTYEGIEPSLVDKPEALEKIREMRRQVDLEYLKQDLINLTDESLEGVTRVKQIAQDLKDFSHVDEAEWQWADLHKGLDSTLNIVWNELKYKAEVAKDYGDLPQVECVPSQLNQVFMNLLVNAGHAIAERGVITIRTGTDGADWVWLEVTDTGQGIAEEHRQRIFDPFFTTKPVGKGTGLGLSLSYGIINKHGGQIEVRSEVGEGSTFRVRLPVGQQQATACSGEQWQANAGGH